MKIKNHLSKTLLVLSLAAVSSGSMAVESGVDGAASTSNTSIGNNWVALTGSSLDINPPAGTVAYNCVVTCTASFKKPDSV